MSRAWCPELRRRCSVDLRGNDVRFAGAGGRGGRNRRERYRTASEMRSRRRCEQMRVESSDAVLGKEAERKGRAGQGRKITKLERGAGRRVSLRLLFRGGGSAWWFVRKGKQQ